MLQVEDRYRVQSVDRAIDVIETLAASPNALTLTDLARSVGGSKSSVFATLQTLTARDLVWSTGNGQDRRYQLGLGLARLGDAALNQVSFRDVALPVLRALTAETGLTSRAAAWGGDCAVAIARVNGSTGINFDLHMGSRETLHSSSVGKSMLFPLSDEELRTILSSIPLPRHTAHTLVTVDALTTNLAEARARGYAVDDEEDSPDIICVGAPVYDYQGTAIGAISVTRIKSTITLEEIHTLGTTTMRHAARLSTELGWPQP
jgi:IclR family acetate operon transcriptional repressor